MQRRLKEKLVRATQRIPLAGIRSDFIDTNSFKAFCDISDSSKVALEKENWCTAGLFVAVLLLAGKLAGGGLGLAGRLFP